MIGKRVMAEPIKRGKPLSPKQRLLLAMMADGKTTKAMALETGNAYWTICAHVRETLLKMGAGNRAQAVAMGYEQGLLVKEASGWSSPTLTP